jgi:hypothetical protein
MSNASDATEIRFPFEVRWPSWQDRGWLEVRDCFTGQWLQVWAADVPPWWRREAQMKKTHTTSAGARR